MPKLKNDYSNIPIRLDVHAMIYASDTEYFLEELTDAIYNRMERSDELLSEMCKSTLDERTRNALKSIYDDNQKRLSAIMDLRIQITGGLIDSLDMEGAFTDSEE